MAGREEVAEAARNCASRCRASGHGQDGAAQGEAVWLEVEKSSEMGECSKRGVDCAGRGVLAVVVVQGPGARLG